MERETALQIVTEACLRAVPEIANQPCKHRLMADENGCPFTSHERPIRLSDVLLAIWQKDLANRTRVIVESSGQFRTWTPDEGNLLRPEWNLRADNLTEQSEDTILFLADLLK